MRISALNLLGAWERGRDTQPLEAALVVLEAAGLDVRTSDLSVGEVDALLLRIRSALFGDRIEASVQCPACRDLLEIDLTTGELMVAVETDARATSFELQHDGYSVRFHMPSARAVADAVGAGDPERVHQALLRQSIEDATRGATPVAPEDLPESVERAVSERMAAIDPQADVSFDVACPACGHRWSARFDAAAYFFRELDGWARRTLADVHTLAARYGWSERDILAMSPMRRRMYLELGES